MGDTCEICHRGNNGEKWVIEVRNKSYPLYHIFCSRECSQKWEPPSDSISYENLMASMD